MRNILIATFMATLAIGLNVGDAEAARLGGSKSVGMQRSVAKPRPSSPYQQATPSAPSAPAGTAPAAAPKRNWMGTLAGLAAGVGIAALLSHFGMGAGLGNILMLGLLAMAAVFVFKLLFRRNTATARPVEPMQYAGADVSPSMTPTPQVTTLYGSTATETAPTSLHIPDGFDTETFLRVAKLNFIRLQAANDAKNIEDIREFVSPEMFAEIKLQMDERGNTAQQTDVVTLDAELLEITTEANRHIASVHFSGMIREEIGAAAAPFEEIWNLSKPTEGKQGWVITGIQQLN